MTPAELQSFIKSQLNMEARIAHKANRARIGAAAFTNVKSSSGPSLGDRIIAALDRLGVAPSSRPLSKEGAQTFHFALTTVSRTSEYAAKMKNDVAGKAGDHMGYVEREGAAETLDPAIKREADAIDREAWAILGGQEYIERPDAAEVMPDGRTHASFGNIAATLEARVEFWRSLEEAAAKPKTHGIVTDRNTDKAFWDQVDRDPSAPATLRATPQWIALPVDHSMPDATRLNKPISVSRVNDKEAIAVAQYAMKHRSRAKNQKPAVIIDPGRGGRIQNRIIVELPHELSADDRLAVAKAFCSKHFVEGREAALPYWCVIHKPDHHNDARNMHMHIVFAERPAARMKHPETGEKCWDFEVIEITTDKHWNKRSRRPFEQSPDRSLQDRSWVKNARKSYAEIANAALKAAGKSKIYDERTYKAMGIDVDPRKRINGKDYVNEKKGVSTPAGTPAVLEQWRREEERLSKRHPSFEPDSDVIAKFDCEIRRWWRSSTSTKYKLMLLRHEWTIAQAHRKYYAAEAAANALIMRKIKSKLAPPLGTDARLAKDATDYLKMFKADLIDKHHEAAEGWKKNERYLMTSLRQAQQVDPKIATSADFLGGGAILQAMNGMMTASRLLAVSRPELTTFQLAKTMMDTTREDADEKRAIRRSLEAAKAAREGTLEEYPESVWQKPPRTATKTESAVEMTVAPAASEAAAPAGPAVSSPQAIGTMETDHPSIAGLKVPAPETVPRWGADGTGRFALPPTSPPPTSATKPVGDEIRMTFLSDTGAPVHRRVYSPTRIRETKAQADAIIAAAEKRRADREVNYKAARAAEERHARTKAFFDAHPVKPPGQRPNPAAPTATAPDIPPASTSAYVSPAGVDASAVQASTPTPTPSPEVAKADPTPAPVAPTVATAGTKPAAAPSRGPGTPRQATGPAIATTRSAPPEADQVSTTEGKGPLLDNASTVCQPNTIPKPLVASTTAATTPTEDRTQTPEGIDLADIEVTDAPPKKKKPVLTAEQLRRRALLAAKDRGRGR